MTHELQSLVTETVRLLIEAGVLDGVDCPEPSCDDDGRIWVDGDGPFDHEDCNGTGKVEHPLRPLLVAQDAYGVESGLTVPCPCGWNVPREPFWCAACCDYAIGLPEGSDLHSPDCDCHGTGRVARSLDGWPESAIVGWVQLLCRSVGWKIAGLQDDDGRFEVDIWRASGSVWWEFVATASGTTEAEAALSALLAAVKAQVQA